jgi:hypothetical protein
MIQIIAGQLPYPHGKSGELQAFALNPVRTMPDCWA